MIVRAKHPKKPVEDAIRYAEKMKWGYQETGNSAHAWGRMLCPHHARDGCSMSIWSTPKSPDNHAKQIRKRVNSCPHKLVN